MAFEGGIEFEDPEGDSLWRVSLETPQLPPVDREELARNREEAEEAVFERLFSYKGVTVNYLNGFTRMFRNNTSFRGIELYALTSEVEGIPKGATVSRLETVETDDEGELYSCHFPGTGIKFINPNDLVEKERKSWTIDDLCRFCLVNEVRRSKAPFSEESEGAQRTPFRGTFIVCPAAVLFQDVVDSVTGRLKDTQAQPEAMETVWLECFSSNVATIYDLDSLPDNERREQLELLQEYTRKSLALFHDVVVYFDDWFNPSILYDGWTIWQLFTLFQQNREFSVMNTVENKNLLTLIYDREEKGIFDLIENMDPTKLKFTSEFMREVITEELVSQRRGFLSVKNSLEKRFRVYFLLEVEEDVKQCPDPKDTGGMERFAIVLFKTGNFMRKHGELRVAKSYFDRARINISKLQRKNEKAQAKRRSFDDITVDEQLNIDRVNGISVRIEIFLAFVAIENNQMKEAKEHLKRADSDSRKIVHQRFEFVKDVSEAKAFLGKREALQKCFDRVGCCLFNSQRRQKTFWKAKICRK